MSRIISVGVQVAAPVDVSDHEEMPGCPAFTVIKLDNVNLHLGTSADAHALMLAAGRAERRLKAVEAVRAARRAGALAEGVLTACTAGALGVATTANGPIDVATGANEAAPLIHLSKTASSTACGLPTYRPPVNLGVLTVDLAKVTCPACRPKNCMPSVAEAAPAWLPTPAELAESAPLREDELPDDAPPGERRCLAQSPPEPGDGFLCTLPDGHDSSHHVARADGSFCARWLVQPVPPRLLRERAAVLVDEWDGSDVVLPEDWRTRAVGVLREVAA